MTLILAPKTGEDVNILAPHARLRGFVTARSDEELMVELEQTPIRRPFRFPTGSKVDVEWLHAQGVMQLTARVGTAQEEPRPTLVLELLEGAEPAERRELERAEVRLAVSAWSPAQPTRRSQGETVNLTAGGALVHLPELSPLAATVQLRIAIRPEPVNVTASIRWRREDGLAGVEFDRISPEGQERLISFLREPR